MTSSSPPRIIYLDQNKWIELLRAEKSPKEYPQQSSLLQGLFSKAHAGEFVFPLSATNIYETYKINDPERRKGLAFLQARLSGGIVFRARRGRLEGELATFLCDAYQLPPLQWPVWWFLSDLFFDAFPEADAAFSDKLINHTREHPGHSLNSYLTTAPDEERFFTVKAWTAGSEALRARIELRREQHKNQTLAMRRRIYSVLMLSEEIEHLAKLAEKYGVRWNSMNDIGSSIARRIVEEMPVYYAERELVLRLEAQPRPIDENDMRDIDAYATAIPYADDIVGENQLVNLARQARLGEKYNTRLETDILALAA
jgi:hypothetical protein